jgi:peptide/nickel transport system substrate-binding protein
VNTRLVFVCLALAALSFGAAFAQADPRPMLRVGTQDLASVIDPGRDHGNVGAQLYYLVFDSLVHRDPTSVAPTYVPALATSWHFVSDTELELSLRPDVRFHDGTVMTAEDVQFSIERLLSGAFAPYESIRGQFFASLERVDVVDDLTVRVVTTRPDPILLTLLSTSQAAIVPKAYVEEIGFEAFALEPIGTGPFRVASFIPRENVTLETFADHWGEAPHVSGVEMRAIPELSTRMTALVNDEVDIVTNIPPDQVNVIGGAPCCELREYLTPIFHVIFYDTHDEVMSDPKLRQAMNLAIDRELLVQALWNGDAVVPGAHQFPQFGDLFDPSLDVVRFDPERARALVAASSYDGQVIPTNTYAAYYTNGALAMQAVAEMWEAIGLDVDLQIRDRGTSDDMRARIWSNPMYFPDPAGSYGVMWGPTGARVPAHWVPEHPEYDAVYERFRYSLDVAERSAAYRELMLIWEEEAPFTILYQPIEYYGVRAGVHWQPLPGHQPYVLDFRAYNLRIDGSTAQR